MSRTVAVFLSLVVTLSALSQTLTQERRVVSPAPLTRAANAQVNPDVASNGNGFLAIWLDGRATHAGYQNSGSLLWASHFAADGTLTSPDGFKLADGVFDARIASDGTGYLIATDRSDGIYTQPFDDEGHALADPLKMNTPTTRPITLASNGSGYLLATNDLGSIVWQTLDRLGRPVGAPQPLFASSTTNNTAIVVTSDSAYHLIYVEWGCLSGISCTYLIVDVAVTNGKAAAPRTLVPPGNFLESVSAASSGDQILVAWTNPDGINEQLFDSSDNALTAAQQLGPPVLPTVTVSWDGERYLVSHSNGTNALVGQRIGRDGALLDSSPFVIATAAAYETFARGSGRTAVVWSAGPLTVPTDIYGRVVFDFNELAAAAAEPLRLSNAPSVQHEPATASIAGKRMRVWRAGDGNGSIQMAIDGGDATVLSPENGDFQHDPDVAAIGDVALVVWRSDTPALRRVLGVRIDANGTPLDATPIVIDAGTLFASPAIDRVSVATDGHSFLVAWSGQYVVDAKRIATDGSLIDAAPIVASHNDSFITAGVKVVWTGTEYVVVFAYEDNHLTLRPPLAMVQLYTARITSSGVALDTSENRSVYLEKGASLLGAPSVAAAGDRLVIAFSEMPASLSITTELHTVELSANRVLAQLTYPFNYGIGNVHIAARGNTFVVTWSQDGTNGSEVRAQLLDRGESFLVAGDDAYDVTVMPDANGFSFTYARTDPEADDVARLFTRDLVLPSERHRAVR